MKTTDLRINNHVQLIFPDGEITAIVEVIKWDSLALNIDGRIGWYDSTGIKPIPLTEQWLLDFGFEDEGGDDYVVTKGEHTLLLTVEKDSISVSLIYLHGAYNSQYIFLKDILYVHQLQNLYFALMQEELILKERSKE